MSNACAMLVALSSVSLTGDPQQSGYARDAAQNLVAIREYVDINAVNATDGSLILLDQVRTIDATASIADQEDTDRADAPDFDPWLEAVVAAADNVVTASASQNSVIQANSITAAGSSSIRVGLSTVDASSHSTLEVVFAVLEPVDVSITGAIGARSREESGSIWARANVGLFNNITGSVFFQSVIATQEEQIEKEPVSFSGPIDVGVYTFHASASAGKDSISSDGSEDASFVVDFSVVPQGPQSSDLDTDGDVDLFDYNKFQLEFSGPK